MQYRDGDNQSWNVYLPLSLEAKLEIWNELDIDFSIEGRNNYLLLHLVSYQKYNGCKMNLRLLSHEDKTSSTLFWGWEKGKEEIDLQPNQHLGLKTIDFLNNNVAVTKADGEKYTYRVKVSSKLEKGPQDENPKERKIIFPYFISLSIFDSSGNGEEYNSFSCSR